MIAEDVAPLWSLPISHRILAIGLDWELPCVASNQIPKIIIFKFQKEDLRCNVKSLKSLNKL